MMDEAVQKLIAQTAAGEVSLAQALAQAAVLTGQVTDIGCARVDHGRAARCGFPEFIYGAGKNAEQLIRIVGHMVEKNGEAFATRLDRAKLDVLQQAFPAGEADALAGTFAIYTVPRGSRGEVAVLCAGTSDLSVAQEALNTLRFCGIGATLYSDVGVACIERVLVLGDKLRKADCCIVAAGMEGALPSVVGGLTPAPVIAVPTSVGYGAALGGFAALSGMLNSCASGVTVVNIDNGFGAACAAIRILNQKREK